jgi:hypothetical protein
MTFVAGDDVERRSRRRRHDDASDAENRLGVAQKMARTDSDSADDSDNNNNSSSSNNNNGCHESDCRYEKLQIETEFRILQSIIPGVSQQENVTEVSYFSS